MDINIRVVIFGTLLVTQLMLFGTVMKVVTKPMLFGTHRIIDNLGTLSLLLIIQTSMQLYNIDNLGMPFCALKFVLVHNYMTTQNSKCGIPSVSHIFRVWLLTLYQTKDILLIRLQNKAITSMWKIYFYNTSLNMNDSYCVCVTCCLLCPWNFSFDISVKMADNL